jgi:hypothetical protein
MWHACPAMLHSRADPLRCIQSCAPVGIDGVVEVMAQLGGHQAVHAPRKGVQVVVPGPPAGDALQQPTLVSAHPLTDPTFSQVTSGNRAVLSSRHERVQVRQGRADTSLQTAHCCEAEMHAREGVVREGLSTGRGMMKPANRFHME